MKSPTRNRLRRQDGAKSDAAVRRAEGPASSAAALRMRDLVRLTGLPRETIHFYMQQGLLPRPLKTGRNTAVYGSEHLERLRRIRELQERQFLPLKAIRAILDETAVEDFTPEQEDLVRRVRATLRGWTDAQQRPAVAVSNFVPSRVPLVDLRELVRHGLVSVRGTAGGGSVSEDDAVILECWAQFREAGLGPRQGVAPAELKLYDEAMERLLAREARLALRAYEGAPVEEISRMIEQVGPVIGRLLGALHRKRLRRFLADFGRNARRTR
jgi:DNA-binding transcriptional MerR regulator